MKLVVDTNIIISALLRDGISRKILFSPFIHCYTPDYTLDEINKYEKLICEKAKVSHDGFKLVLNLIFEKIQIIPIKDYQNKISQAKTIIKDIDDVSFIALSLALNADGIWTDDKHFKNRKDLSIFRTKELARIYKPR
jgi:predicted nucleic acid-binding protein